MMARWGLVLMLALLVVGCGQPKQKVAGDPDMAAGKAKQAAIDMSLPAVDFAVQPPAEALDFDVEGIQMIEVMGTSMETMFRYKWRASQWKENDEGSRTAAVRFTKVQATERRGQTATPEPIESFERLENFSTRFRLTDKGFEPVQEPARDQEFMMAFAALSQGLSAFDFEKPDAPKRPGESWTITMDMEDLGPMGEAATDSLLHITYTGNIRYKKRDCARVEIAMNLPLDGEIEQGPASSHITGSMEAEATALYDLEKRFYVLVKQNSIMKIKAQDYDAEGMSLGGEKSFAQNGNFKIEYSGR